ncbi:hypothetical protein NL676_023236 [Syzygium grande]|nr:hypothetical protein NL676_023236 [Syzygium grande]
MASTGSQRWTNQRTKARPYSDPWSRWRLKELVVTAFQRVRKTRRMWAGPSYERMVLWYQRNGGGLVWAFSRRRRTMAGMTSRLSNGSFTFPGVDMSPSFIPLQLPIMASLVDKLRGSSEYQKWLELPQYQERVQCPL